MNYWTTPFQVIVKKLLKISFLAILCTSEVYAIDPLSATVKAASKYSAVKARFKKISTRVVNGTGLSENQLTTIIIGAGTVAAGKVSTKPLKSLTFESGDWDIRPDATYNFRRKSSSIKLEFNLGF